MHICLFFSFFTAESWFNNLEWEFLSLLTEACNELELKNRLSIVLLAKTRQLPMNILEEHHHYIRYSIQQSNFFPSLTVFTNHLNLYSYNFFENGFLIEQNCSERLKAKMANFVDKVNCYQQQSILTEFIDCRCQLVEKMSSPPCFMSMITEHNIDPHVCTLSEIERFRKDFHGTVNIKLSECAIQMFSILYTSNSVIVHWIFPEEIVGKFVYAEYEGLMSDHSVNNLRINGVSSHSVRLFCFITL